MGCNASKGPPKPAPVQGNNSAAKKAEQAEAAAKRAKLNPADFVIKNKVGETIVKEEGSINGEQFMVEECKDCDIFLVDHIATAFIDYCENCRIFVGPIESSVMIRNCKGCNIIMACQQFRSRDCSDCRIALFCSTEPIIETSSNMQFACFDFFYFSLREQFCRAKLRLWNNKWSQIYDFNKNEGIPNFSFLAQEEVPRLLSMEKCTCITAEERTMDHVVPITLGSRPRNSQEACLVLFMPESDAYIEAFLAKATKTDSWTIVRTRSMVLDDAQCQQTFAWAKEKKDLIKACKGKEVAGVEICGSGCFEQVEDALASTGLAAGSKSIRLIPKDSTNSLSKAFFETWKDGNV